MTRPTSVVSAAAALSLTFFCFSCTGRASDSSPAQDPGVPAGSFKLVAFDNCDELLRDLRTAAKQSVGPYGWGGVAVPAVGGPAARAGVAEQGGNDKAAPMAPNEAGGYSTTNTHEAGVDEPDVVKTDGKRIVTVSGGVLRVVDTATKKVTGTVEVGRANTDTGTRSLPKMGGPAASQLLLSGDHALVFGSDYTIGADDRPSGGPEMTLVDLAGPPKVLGRYSMEGNLVDARQVGSVARIVLRSYAKVDFPSNARNMSNDERIAANQKAIDAAPVSAWLPAYKVTDGAGKQTTGRVDCGAVSRPAEYSGSTMLSVLSFDLKGSSFTDGTPASLVADGQTVYANGTNLYVTNDQRWRSTWNNGSDVRTRAVAAKTQIYRFDITGSGRPKYTAGGEVEGWLLNQYALSDWNGHLRVATTTEAQTDTPRSSAPTQSIVYVLGESGGKFTVDGKVTGLGKGERIFGVRFVDGTGYVVTFRQTDPLYTLDLRDPKAPKLVGELKVNGYSAYLHPADDGRLIGVGHDANDQGRLQGTQVSLFDVHDPAKPTRLAQFVAPDASSPAEYDPHAFLYWKPTGLLVVPLYSYTQDKGPVQQVVALNVKEGSITKLGAVSHPAADRNIALPSQIVRSVVVGDTLWTISSAGLKASNLSTLADQAWLPYTG
jgi:hypothetical protein